MITIFDKKHLKLFFRAYSNLIFIDNYKIGLILFIVSFINFSVAVSGIIAVVASLLFAHFIKIKEEFLFGGFYIYNSLLVGMGVGYLFYPTLLTSFFIAVLSIFTFVFSYMLNKIFIYYKLPILSLPFSFITIFSYLAMLKYSSFYSNLINKATIFDIDLPLIISSFFKALGTIIFLPNNIAGIIIALILLYHSRIMFFVAISGFYFGVFLHSLLISSLNEALVDVYSFNYIITAIALCGIFLLPTIKNYIISMIAVIVSVILSDSMNVFFNHFGITVFTLPFNLTVIGFVFILGLIGYEEFNYYPQSSPENSISFYLNNIFRFASNKIKIALPFSGEWQVYQGFNGKWTHKGDFAQAYDFIIKKNNKSYANNGYYLSDYYAFGQNVLAPVNGYIVDLRNDLEDNIIGSVDRINNWGNFIIIKSDFGFFVKICHLMQYSITKKIGEYVKIGEILAKCGNSGYSPEPHIHIQVQYSGILGAKTAPFVFDMYEKENFVLFNSLPKENENINSIIVNKFFADKFAFSLDEEYFYDVYKNNKKIASYFFKVKMNSLGEFYFYDKDWNKLYFYTYSNLFYFYKYEGKNSYLLNLFKLASKIPLTTKKIKYSDFLPRELFRNKWYWFYGIISFFNKKFLLIKNEYELNQSYLKSKFGKVTFDKYNKGFKTIEFDDIVLQRNY